jgi:hypothetical protein
MGDTQRVETRQDYVRTSSAKMYKLKHGESTLPQANEATNAVSSGVSRMTKILTIGIFFVLIVGSIAAFVYPGVLKQTTQAKNTSHEIRVAVPQSRVSESNAPVVAYTPAVVSTTPISATNFDLELTGVPADFEQLTETPVDTAVFSPEEKTKLTSQLQTNATLVLQMQTQVLETKSELLQLREKVIALERLNNNVQQLTTQVNENTIKLAEIKLENVVKTEAKKRSQVRILNKMTVEINEKLYNIGDLLQIKGSQYLIMKIEVGVGVYLQNVKQEKFLLKVQA